MPSAENIVITGMGVMTPIGCDQGSFWNSLRQGRSGAKPVTSMDTSDLTRHVACQITDPVDESVCSGRASQLAILATRQALADAGLDGAVPDGARARVIIGTTMGETQFIEEPLFDDDTQWLNDDHCRRIASGMPGCIARNIQADCRASGGATDVYGACAAGNMAIAMGRQALLEKQCDLVIAGGSDGFSRLAFIGFMRLRLTAAEECRPFDEKRDGLFVGEGATVFVLERASDAKARGARVRARVVGCAITSESYHPTRPDPEGDGLKRALRGALSDAGLAPADIDYVNAHGTGTAANDAIEMKVMQECLSAGTPFSSTKALTGHTMGAAGAMEAAACVLSLEHQTLIPTWHLTNVLQPCDMDALQGTPRQAELRCAMNNSAGFGGYNSSVILTAP